MTKFSWLVEVELSGLVVASPGSADVYLFFDSVDHVNGRELNLRFS